jgi:hypothetical protein
MGFHSCFLFCSCLHCGVLWGRGGRWVFVISLLPDCSTVVGVGLPVVFVFVPSCSIADDGVGLMFSLGFFWPTPACSIADGLIQ